MLLTAVSPSRRSGELRSGGRSEPASAFSFFNSSSTCGGTITLTFHLQDGALDLGNVSIPFKLGAQVNSAPALTENFDGVSAPTLPSGWTTSQTGPVAPWVTSTTAPDTAPNSAFGGGAETPGDNSLTSPIFAVPAAPLNGVDPGVRLTFRNSYNTEPGFDGGVLEISVNGGAYTDIITAGGSFIEGGYNGTIGVTDSVLTGRQAWTGTSGGIILHRFCWLRPIVRMLNSDAWLLYTGTIQLAAVWVSILFRSMRVVGLCSGAYATRPANITVSNDPDSGAWLITDA